MEQLFECSNKELISYGKEIIKVIQLFATENSINNLQKTEMLDICKIPTVLRFLGIPSGTIKISPKYVGHIIGISSDKTGYNSGSLHNISLAELSNLPRILNNPDAVFRSNTHPNESIILCKKIQERKYPVLVALKINISSALSSSNVVLSFYEKDSNSNQFFSDLLSFGFCLYVRDWEFMEKFTKKTEAGVRDRTPGPIPAGAVTCTASSNSKVLTKNDIVNQYKCNSEQVLVIVKSIFTLNELMKRNLEELGYNTKIIDVTKPIDESLYKNRSLSFAVGRYEDVKNLDLKNTQLDFKKFHLEKIGMTESFMPTPIFAQKLPTLAEMRQRKEIIKGKQR